MFSIPGYVVSTLVCEVSLVVRLGVQCCVCVCVCVCCVCVCVLRRLERVCCTTT